jgi:hypothetical protein
MLKDFHLESAFPVTLTLPMNRKKLALIFNNLQAAIIFGRSRVAPSPCPSPPMRERVIPVWKFMGSKREICFGAFSPLMVEREDVEPRRGKNMKSWNQPEPH